MSGNGNGTAPAPAPGGAAPSDNSLWVIPVGGGGQGGEYHLIPAGTYAGRIIGLFDVGHQSIETTERGWQWIHKLALVFELDRTREDGQPFVVAKGYTWSLRESSNLFKLIATLTGYKPRDGDPFDLLSLLGCPVMIGITNNTGNRGDFTYHDISTVTAFPDGYAPPKQHRASVFWSISSGARFPTDSDWHPQLFGKTLKQMAMESREGRERIEAYKRDRAQGQGQGQGQAQAPPPPPQAPPPPPANQLRESRWGSPPAATSGGAPLRDLGPPAPAPAPAPAAVGASAGASNPLGVPDEEIPF